MSVGFARVVVATSFAGVATFGSDDLKKSIEKKCEVSHDATKEMVALHGTVPVSEKETDETNTSNVIPSVTKCVAEKSGAKFDPVSTDGN